MLCGMYCTLLFLVLLNSSNPIPSGPFLNPMKTAPLQKIVIQNGIINMEELKLKCEALRVSWIHEETFRLKNKASVADIFEQMTRMKTTKTPAHTSIKMFFRGESVGVGVLEAMKEWHDKCVAFRSMHQPGTPADAASAKPMRQKRSFNKENTQQQAKRHQSHASRSCCSKPGCGSTAQPQISAVDVGALTRAASGHGYISSSEVSSGTVTLCRGGYAPVCICTISMHIHLPPHHHT